MKRIWAGIAFLLTGLFVLAACSPGGSSQVSVDSPSNGDPAAEGERNYDDYRIVTLLPRDAIPAIDDPQFLDVTQADEEYSPDELVIGVEFNGEARAYSIPFLSGHEIVNDTVGGVKIAVTW